MDIEDVWSLVERARREIPDDADAEAVAERMVALLAQREPAEIMAFAQPLWKLLADSYRTDLWAAAYLINGGASDDGFDYFRGWLVAQGRETYERALADPDSLADHPAVLDEEGAFECEDVLGVPWDAYRAVTGVEPPPGIYLAPYPDLEPMWDFDDEDEMRERLPRLSALFLDSDDED